MDQCYQAELARQHGQEELKLVLESQHILWPRKTITGEYTIDLMMNAIDQRFDQPSFDTYAKMESLLIKTLAASIRRTNPKS